jgi:hypothetical protein
MRYRRESIMLMYSL